MHALALADQAVVSATSFLTTVMIGRWTDPAQLGAYAIGISVLVSALAIQESLISLPYSIQRHRPVGTPAEYAGSSLANSGLLAAVIVIVLIMAALGLSAGGARPELLAMTWALAGVMPFALSREFGRRFAFAHLQLVRALILDVAVGAIQLAVLFWLGWTGQMSAVTACGALGAACGLSAIGWLYLARGDFAIRVPQVWATMKQSWSLGKWLFVGQLTVQVQRYITYWLLVVIAGAAVTGVYTACMSVVSFANPLMIGLGNILTPRSVLAWKEGGGPGLRRQAIRDALLLGAVMAAFCAALLFAGDDVMRFLYHGKDYEGHGHTITVLALAMLAAAVGTPASNALASMERPRAIVVVGALGAVLTVVLVWWLMADWGLPGAAYGFLLGNMVGAAGRWIAFLALVPRACDPARVIGVLRKLTGTSDDRGWTIARLDEGDHAIVYAVASTGGRTIWRTYPKLVIKLYKSEAALDADMVHAQFDALFRLHAVLHGRTVNGWKISTPSPVYLCESPLALVMTAVPGRDLNAYAAAGEDLTPEVLDGAARSLAAAMEQSWSRGQIHGDLAPRNLLCDVEAKALSLVDPGTLESCCVCSDIARRWPPAVLDLAHMLSVLGTDVADAIGNSAGRLRRQIFTESALRACMEMIGPREEKQRLLAEIRACAEAHLDEMLALSWSFRGLWRWLVRQIAVRRINATLDWLKAELDTSAGPVETSTYGFASRTQWAKG